MHDFDFDNFIRKGVVMECKLDGDDSEVAALNPVIQPSLSLDLVNALTSQLQAIPTPLTVPTVASAALSDSLASACTSS